MQSINQLIEQVNQLLPQTQCTQCGYNGCRPYAEAIANKEAKHNQCPPGGSEGIARLSRLLNIAVLPLNPNNGTEQPRTLAVIDPKHCIGCTLCIQACPIDAIVGAAKQMHVVLEEWCTGCNLCIPRCPVDCIDSIPVGSDTGWKNWSQQQADQARMRHQRHNARLAQKSLGKAGLQPQNTNLTNANILETQAQIENQQMRKRSLIDKVLRSSRMENHIALKKNLDESS